MTEPVLPKWAGPDDARILQYIGVHVDTKEPMEVVAASLTREPDAAITVPPHMVEHIKTPEPTYTVTLWVHAPKGTDAYDRLRAAKIPAGPDGRWYVTIQHTGLSRQMGEMMALAHAPVTKEELDRAADQDGWGKAAAALPRERERIRTDRIVRQHEQRNRQRATRKLRQRIREFSAIMKKLGGRAG